MMRTPPILDSSSSQSPADVAIASLKLTGRPLVIIDVDEVVVHMVKPLIPWLERRGLRLDLTSYSLGGNIRHADTNAVIPKDVVQELIQAFFDDEIHAQEAVDNAAAVIGRLEQVCDVVLLTNAPHRHRETRRTSLVAQGINATLITNDGPKGPPVALLRQRALAAGAPDTLVFIDDSANNLDSVRASVPTATLVHFIAHPTFRSLTRDVAGVGLKTGDWLEVETYVMGVLAGR
jgi:FMN phosphatase YigB (HAD superfamily)